MDKKKPLKDFEQKSDMVRFALKKNIDNHSSSYIEHGSREVQPKGQNSGYDKM